MLSDEQLSTAYWGARVVVPMYRQGLGDYRQHTHAAGLRAVESAVRADMQREVQTEQCGNTWTVEPPKWAGGKYAGTYVCALPGNHEGSHVALSGMRWSVGDATETQIEASNYTANMTDDEVIAEALRVTDENVALFIRSLTTEGRAIYAAKLRALTAKAPELFIGTLAALDTLSIRTPSTPNQQGAEHA